MSGDVAEMNQRIDFSRRLLKMYDEVVIKGFERLQESVLEGRAEVLVCTSCEEDCYLEWDCEMCLEEHEGHTIEILPAATFISHQGHQEL